MELRLSNEDDRDAHLYWGANKTDSSTDAYGIRFECKLEDETIDLLSKEIQSGKLPYEYYMLTWTTFQGSPYNLLRKPISSILIDTTTTEAWSSFYYFNRNLFNNKYAEDIKIKARNDFRQNVDEALSKLGLEALNEKQHFGISSRKLVLDNLLSVFDEDIPLENKGKGIENIIKTRISLDKVKNKISTVLIEEPENHLSFSTLLKMINEINERTDVCQTIISTHSNLIVSKLNLKNILWLCNNQVLSLNDVDPEVADYFCKADNNNFLNMLLANRVVLVEGATEYLLIPKFYEQQFGNSIEKDKISVISCNGLSYKNYLHIAEKVSKKVAVITDNDTDQKKIDYMSNYNSKNQEQHIFMSSDNIEEWTWEASIYKSNKEILDKFIEVAAGVEYKFHGKPYGQHLGKMLNNKTETAYKILTADLKLKIPDYIKAALEWVRQ